MKQLVFLSMLFKSLGVVQITGASERGDLYIVTENYPPYEMLEPVAGQKGFDYEVATEIFTLLGFNPDINFVPWKLALRLARLGETVGILTCAYRKEREEFIIFSEPISKFTNGFFVRKGFDGPKPMVLEDVKLKRLDRSSPAKAWLP
jgi:polar amino acid transport system substrate-binding protein